MPHLTITVNDTIVMDGDLGSWSSEPPFISEQKAAIAAKRDEPWSIPLLGLVAKAATGGHIKTIDIHTHADGWTLNVHN